MERLKEAFKNHQKSILIGGAIMGAAAAFGMYRMRKGTSAVYRGIARDKEFNT